MTTDVRTRPSIRFRGRSFMALVLAPEPPLAEWFDEFDALADRSPGFFAGRPVVVDIAAVPHTRPELVNLMTQFQSRKIRVMALEGADAFKLGADARGLPPILNGGRNAQGVEMPKDSAAAEAPEPETAAEAVAAPQPKPSTLMVQKPVRSGQSIIHPDGDVIVVGSVASGAEIVAGGSIHVYGALRGRALAGWSNPGARIFCSSLEAELLAIDGLYKTADDMEQKFRGQKVSAWLDGDAMMMAVLD